MLISNSFSLFEINYFNECVSIIIFIIIIIIIIIITIIIIIIITIKLNSASKKELNNSLLELILAIFC